MFGNPVAGCGSKDKPGTVRPAIFLVRALWNALPLGPIAEQDPGRFMRDLKTILLMWLFHNSYTIYILLICLATIMLHSDTFFYFYLLRF